MWNFASKLADQAQQIKSKVETSFDEAIRFQGDEDEEAADDDGGVVPTSSEAAAPAEAKTAEVAAEREDEVGPTEFGEEEVQRMLAEARRSLAEDTGKVFEGTGIKAAVPALASAEPPQARASTGDALFEDMLSTDTQPHPAGVGASGALRSPGTGSRAPAAELSETVATPAVAGLEDGGWGDFSPFGSEAGAEEPALATVPAPTAAALGQCDATTEEVEPVGWSDDLEFSLGDSLAAEAEADKKVVDQHRANGGEDPSVDTVLERQSSLGASACTAERTRGWSDDLSMLDACEVAAPSKEALALSAGTNEKIAPQHEADAGRDGAAEMVATSESPPENSTCADVTADGWCDDALLPDTDVSAKEDDVTVPGQRFDTAADGDEAIDTQRRTGAEEDAALEEASSSHLPQEMSKNKEYGWDDCALSLESSQLPEAVPVECEVSAANVDLVIVDHGSASADDPSLVAAPSSHSPHEGDKNMAEVGDGSALSFEPSERAAHMPVDCDVRAADVEEAIVEKRGAVDSDDETLVLASSKQSAHEVKTSADRLCDGALSLEFSKPAAHVPADCDFSAADVGKGIADQRGAEAGDDAALVKTSSNQSQHEPPQSTTDGWCDSASSFATRDLAAHVTAADVDAVIADDLGAEVGDEATLEAASASQSPQEASKSVADGWSKSPEGDELAAPLPAGSEVVAGTVEAGSMSDEASPAPADVVANATPADESPDDATPPAEALLAEDYRSRIKSIYLEYNPGSADNLDPILAKYEGKESRLYAALCKRYGIDASESVDSAKNSPTAAEPTSLTEAAVEKPRSLTEAAAEPPEAGSEAAVVATPLDAVSAGASEVERIRGLIVDVYKVHNPEKIAEVDTLLMKYAGKEAKLYTAVCKKYGVPEETAANGGIASWFSTQASALSGGDLLRTLQEKAEAAATSLRQSEEASAAYEADASGPRLGDEAARAEASSTESPHRGEELARPEVASPRNAAASDEVSAAAVEESEADMYRARIVEFYRENNPDKLNEIGGMLARYKGKEKQLYIAICRKYGAPVAGDSSGEATTRVLDESAMAAGAEAGADETTAAPGEEAADVDANASAAFTSWFQRPAVGSVGGSGGLLKSGFSTFEKLTSAAEGLKKNVERQFDDAVRSQEDQSVSEGLQSLRGAAVAAAMSGDPSEGSGVAVVSVGEPDGVATGSTESISASAGTSAAGAGGLSPELMRELECLRAEKLRWVDEKQGLVDEGLRMSKRMHAVEERMKEVVADARRSQERVTELERTKGGLEAKVAKLSGRTANAEALADEQKGELRSTRQELARVRAQLQGVDRLKTEEQESLERRSEEQTERLRQLEARLDSANRERGELVATNRSLAASLEEARAAADAAEGHLLGQQAEAARLAEEQQKRLEEVELEFARQSLPYARQIAALEGRLASQDQRLVEREAETRDAVAEAQRRERETREELEGLAVARREEVAARQEELRRQEQLAAEVGELRRTAAEAWSAREAAERGHEDVQAELRFQTEQRRLAEVNCRELTDRIEEISQRCVQLEAKAATAPAAQAAAAVASVILPPVAPAPEPAEARRLRLEIDALRRQRDELTRESAQLQQSLDCMRADPRGAVQPRNLLLEQKFEAALQMIGQLQEELEAVRS